MSGGRAPARVWALVDRGFCAPVPAARLGAWRALVGAVAIYDVLLYAPLVFADAADVTAGRAGRPWTPLYYMQVLGLQPIGTDAARTLFAVTIAALLACAFGLFARWSCVLGAATFLWWTGLAYSFGKPHHDKVALAFALVVLPLAPVGARVSLDAIGRAVVAAWRGGPVSASAREVSGLPIRFVQITLAIGYCGAGLSKLLLGGLDWFNGYTLQGIMLTHDGNWSRSFGGSVGLCQLQSIGVVSVQTLFPLVFVWPASRWFFLPAATGFHLLTWQTMDTGPYMRVWLLLFAFLPLERFAAAWAELVRSRPLPGLFAFAATVGYVWLVLAVAGHVVPVWALAAAAGPLLLALVMHGLPSLSCRVTFARERRQQRLAVALLRAFDWGRRCEFVAGPGFAFAHHDGSAARHPVAAVASRLPVLLPFLPLLLPMARRRAGPAAPARPDGPI